MRILLVEDEKRLNHSIKFQLEKEGYPTDSCYDGEEALYYIKECIHDLIILDRMLPGLDGLTVLKKTRALGINTPVILLTALGTVQDRIDGLNHGADDYLVKPFDFNELLARICSIARRPRELKLAHTLRFGDITLLPDENRLTGPNASCTLSKKESALLESLLLNLGQTLSRAVLLNKVWGLDSDVEEGNLDNYIYFLRRRLKSVGSRTRIKTVRGIGYSLEES